MQKTVIIDTLWIKEAEIENNYPVHELEIRDRRLGIETSEKKGRVAIYLKMKISYKRRLDIEGKNNHIIIIDIDMKKDTEL